MRLVCFKLCRPVRERAGVRRDIVVKRGIGERRGISKDEGSSRMHRLDYFGRISGSTIASRLVVFGLRDTAATTATATAATVAGHRLICGLSAEFRDLCFSLTLDFLDLSFSFFNSVSNRIGDCTTGTLSCQLSRLDDEVDYKPGRYIIMLVIYTVHAR